MMTNISHIAVMGAIFLTIGSVFHIVGTVTNKWTSVSEPHVPQFKHGLFQECLGDQCEDIGDSFRFDNDLLLVVRTFAVVGSILALLVDVGCFLTLSVLFTEHRSRHRTRLVLGVIFTTLLAVSCILTTLLLHALKVFPSYQDRYTHLSTSFVLSAVGGTLLLLGVAMFATATCLILREQRKYLAFTPRLYHRKELSTVSVITIP